MTDSDTSPRLQLLRNAPTLAGSKPCPKCRAPIPADAGICVHCGYNLATGKSLKTIRISSGRKIRGVLAAAMVLLLALAGAYYALRLRAKPVAPPPKEPAAVPAPAEIPAAQIGIPPAEPAPVAPAAPPPDEARLRFEAQKAKAEETYRKKLDAVSPLYKLKDSVDLRRKDGRIIRGTLHFVGRGTNRIAIVITETGKEIVALKDLDGETRIQLDPKARESHIRDKLHLQVPAPPDRS